MNRQPSAPLEIQPVGAAESAGTPIESAVASLGGAALPPMLTQWHRLRALSVSKLVAVLMVAVVAALVIVVPLLPSSDPFAQNLADSQLRPFSEGHVLGTDTLGRDLLSRIALAGRVSILIAVAVVLIGLVIGVTLGLLAGYFGGSTDYLIMGLADIQLTIPFFLLLIAVIAAVGPSIPTLIAVLGVTSWVRYGRVTRIIAASIREREFVIAATTHGGSDGWIVFKHVFPAVVPQLLTMATFEIGLMITAEASLSYLGLGVQPPTPSWGGMIAEGQRYLQTNPALCITPGIVVFMLLGGLAILGQHFSGVYGRFADIGLRGRAR